jgi:hypothetical protein
MSKLQLASARANRLVLALGWAQAQARAIPPQRLRALAEEAAEAREAADRLKAETRH